ncbi:Signal recognition particle core component [Maudiozyma exigua]|uniref:Signal recognition particle subunit SRP72 n=1 Tax=Maudiozyma exigua TaxID=34358 RepID=A0A9P7BBW4_MAUEX|nr:Signal recognition particle core component [Kazachstania exigua]
MAGNSLTDLLSQLNVQSTHDEHSQVEKTSIQLLENGCTNPGTVLKYCLVALIKQDKYNQALSILEKYDSIATEHTNQIRLEKLYIFYKLNNVTKFKKFYDSIIPDGFLGLLNKKNPASRMEKLRGILHVRAQFCYKNGDMEEAYRIYHHFSINNVSGTDDTTELACNERVPLTVESDMLMNYPPVNELNEESYDILFNESLLLFAKDETMNSLTLLQKAHNLAKTSGYQDDINTLELQLAYVHQLLGNTSDSKEYLNSLIKRLDVGSPMYVLVKNNLLAFQDFSKYKDNINLILRELNTKKINSLNLQNFTHDQWNKLQSNIMFLQLYNNVSIPSKSGCLSSTLHNYTNNVDNVIIEPYRSQAKKLYHLAIKSVSSYSSGSKNSIIGLVLLATQVLVVENQWDNAIRLCELYCNRILPSCKRASDDITTIVYVLFELYRHEGRSHSKLQLFKKIAPLYSFQTFQGIRKNIRPFLRFDEDGLINELRFWKHVAFQYLAAGKPKQTKEMLESLEKIFYFRKYMQDKNVRYALGYTQSYKFEYSSVSNLIAPIDVSSLIDKGIKPFESNSNKIQSSTVTAKRIMKNKLQAKKQKKKQARLQKFLATHDVANKTVDPERWLPLKDRSTYRPKKKQLAKQTQGGAMNKQSEQALDISKKQNKGSNNNNKKKNRKGRK